MSERVPRRPSTRILCPQPTGTDSWEDIAGRRGLTSPGLRRVLRGDLDTITLMALRKEPERRYSSAERFAEDIERFLSGRPVLARADSVLYVARKFMSRNCGKVAVLGVILALLSVSTAVATQLARDAARDRQRAEEETVHARIEATSFKEMAGFLTEALLAASEMGSLDDELIAEHLQLQAEQVRRQHSADRHLEANLLDGLGRVALDLGRNGSAGQWIEESRQIREKVFGHDSLEVALSLESVGLLALADGRSADAEEALRERLRLHRLCPPGVHTDVAAAENDLAVVLRRRGNSAEGEKLHRDALRRRREISGADSPVVAESLNNLSGILMDRTDLEGALPLLREALEIRERSLGPTHPLSLQSRANWASCLYRMGKTDQAEGAFQEALAGFRALRSAGQSGLARTLANHAMLLLSRGEFAAAERDLLEAIEIRRRVRPGEPQVVSLLLKLAQVLGSRGAYSEAHEALVEAEELLLDHPELPPRLHGLVLQQRGSMLMSQGEPDRALGLLMDALEILEEHSAGRVEVIEVTRATLGLCFEACDDFEAAEECLIRASTVLSEQLPAGSGSRIQVQRELEGFRQRVQRDP